MSHLLGTERAIQLIGHIYDAAVRPELWREVVKEIVDLVGGSSGLLLASPASSASDAVAVAFGVEEAFLQKLKNMAGAPGRGLLPSVLAGTMDPAHVCTEVLHAASDASPSLIMCSVFRDAGSGPLTSENRAWMSVLLPHLSRALSVMYRLREAEQISAASLSSLEKIGFAVVLMGNGGEVLLANQAARRMLEERDGLRLVGIRGSLSRRRLAAEDAAAQQRIEVSVESCLRAQSGEASRFHQGVSVPRPSGRKPYLLQFSTLSSAHTAAASAGLAKVMVLLTDLEEPVRLDAELLRKLYRMTHTETTLAERLCQGRRLQEAAQELGISHHTARSHLKSIFRKTGTGGQRELVRMLLALRAPSLA